MARLSVVFVQFTLLGAALVNAYNQTLQEENADCDNNCYFDSFPGGSCTTDAACMCDQQKYREAYFCCMGKYCNPNVLPDSVTRQQNDCDARNMAFTFDSEAVCGIKLTTSAGVLVAAATSTTSAAAIATVTVTATNSAATGDSKSSTSSASTTSGASSTGDQTSSGSSTPTATNGVSDKGSIGQAAMALVAFSAVFLL